MVADRMPGSGVSEPMERHTVRGCEEQQPRVTKIVTPRSQVGYGVGLRERSDRSWARFVLVMTCR